MSSTLKYQLVEELATADRVVELLHSERDLLWGIIDSLSDTYQKAALYDPIKTIYSLYYDYEAECLATTSGVNVSRAQAKMKSLGFSESTPGTMHYTLPGSESLFRVRGRAPSVVVEKSEPPTTFDRWANSIDSIYFLTEQSGADLVRWARSNA